MKQVTKASLIENGYEINTHFWLPGFYFCGTCNKYTLFYGMSKNTESGWRNIEICRDCETGEIRNN